MASAATTTAASTAALPRIGLGIIGAGVIGKRMCDAVKIAAAAGAKLAVAAVCDIDEVLAKALADRAVEASNNTITVATTTDYKALVADDNGTINGFGVEERGTLSPLTVLLLLLCTMCAACAV